jgi:hypothetical protein
MIKIRDENEIFAEVLKGRDHSKIWAEMRG